MIAMLGIVFNVLIFLRCFILFCITWFFNLVCNEDIEVVLFVVACVEFGIILAFVLLLLSVLIPELHFGVWSEVNSDLTYFLLLYFCWILLVLYEVEEGYDTLEFQGLELVVH